MTPRRELWNCFSWTLVLSVGFVATAAFIGAGCSLLFEFFHFLRYGNWPPAAIPLYLIASLSGQGNDMVQWVTGLDWVGLQWLLLNWPLSAVGLATALLMYFVMFIASAWTED